MKFLIIIAARMNSSRLPGKSIFNINEKPSVEFLIERLKLSKTQPKFVLATSNEPQDDPIEEIAERQGIDVYRGSLENVLKRYVLAAEPYDVDAIIRVTGDCPFVHGELVDYVSNQCEKNLGFDLLTTKPDFPSGIDIEVITKAKLNEIYHSNPSEDECEHIFNYIYHRPDEFEIKRISPPSIWVSNKQFLLDTLDDYEDLKSIASQLKSSAFSITDLIKFSNSL
jgi:spore coat polysaccharide biosynthesis protein SpsF